MSLWERLVLAPILHLTMRAKRMHVYRQRAAARCTGRVLEIGIGSGLNLPFLGPAVDALTGLDPSRPLLERAARAARSTALPVELLEGVAEAMPFADASFDTVLSTWTLCSIGDVPRALAEVGRVLVPGGSFVFLEHGLSPQPHVGRWQRRLTPLWCRLSGGCHFDRDIERLLVESGFQLEELEAGYGPGPRVATWLSEGTARPSRLELARNGPAAQSASMIVAMGGSVP